jgi:hypothetical protein
MEAQPKTAAAPLDNLVTMSRAMAIFGGFQTLD